jgi:predicted hydrocarbon binding protein
VSYLLTLNDEHSQRLESLAKNERLPAPELIEKIVIGYLDSAHGTGPAVDLQDVAALKDLYRWDEEKGIIRFTPANKRVMILTARSWDAVEEDLFIKLLKGASPLLTEMGIAYGKATALDYRAATTNPESVAAYFEYLGRTAGWGKFTVSGDLVKGSKVTIRVWDCVFCRSRNASIGRADPCNFLMGVCKGIADTVFDSENYVEESKCCARANEYCEIVIRTATDSDKSAWQMRSGAPTQASMR